MARPRPTRFEMYQTANHATDSADRLQKSACRQLESQNNSENPISPCQNEKTTADMLSITCQTPQAQTAPATSRLLQSLLNITTYTPKLDSVLLRSGSFEDDTTPNIPGLLLEGARLANQLVEDLIAFDTEGLRIRCGVPRLVVFRAGVDARAFVEMYEAFNRDCIDGVVVEGASCGGKEEVLRERAFWSLWHALERSVQTLVEHLLTR